MASIKSSSLLVVGLAIAVDCLLLFACVRASAAGRRGHAQAGAAAGGYAQPSAPAPPFLARALPVIIAQVVLRAARSYCRATLSRLSGVGGSSRRARRASALAGVVAPAPSAHPSLGHSACAISAALRRGTYSSVEVVRAHVAQARAADGCCNAIRSERFAAALVEAAAADVRFDEWRASGRTADILPPLLGVPCVWRRCSRPPPLPVLLPHAPCAPRHSCSIKEAFECPGLLQTGGTLWRRSRLGTSEAPLVQRLRAAGVIILCSTTTPTLGMW